MSSTEIPTRNALKAQAKALRQALAKDGKELSHSQSLELVAKQFGARDWNTLYARAADEPNRVDYKPGQHIRGHYLGQAFSGTLIGVQMMNAGERARLTIHFDSPLDVVPEASFEVLRQRIKATVGPHGETYEKTSNGVPHLVLERH